MDENELVEGFCLDNDSKAEWALKKIKEAQEERDRLMELVEAERKALNEKAEKIERRYNQETGCLKYMLDTYMESVKCKVSKTQKSYQLLTGKLVHKYGGIDFVKDDDALVEWVKDNRPSLLKIEPKVNWAELKKELVVDEDGSICTENGEIIECIRAEKKPDTFDIKF